MTSVGDVNELYRHADTIPRLTDAALQNLAHVEEPVHFTNIPGCVLELKNSTFGPRLEAGEFVRAD